jgi:hypothetical protein
VNAYRTGLLVIATATLGMSAPPAFADIHYGGTGNVGNRATGPSMSLVRHDDGRITARLSSGYTCRKRGFVSRNVKLTGSTADGVSFTVSGRTRLRGRGFVTYTVAGTLASDGVTGTLTEGAKRCPKYSFNILLRPESAPAGAPAAPAPGSLLAGLTSQSAGGLRLPVALRVAKNGRVYGFFQVKMRCGPRAVVVFGNVTPTTAVKPDGTFTRSERFTIRYTDGSRERYRVRFAGRFLADGATGTLRARMQTRKPGKRYYPCDSGTRTWSART